MDKKYPLDAFKLEYSMHHELSMKDPDDLSFILVKTEGPIHILDSCKDNH